MSSAPSVPACSDTGAALRSVRAIANSSKKRRVRATSRARAPARRSPSRESRSPTRNVPLERDAAAWATRIALALVLVGCSAEPSTTPGDDRSELALADHVADPTRPIAPIPGPPVPLDDARAALGRDLWFDPILSRDGRVICNDCHDLSRAGTDGRERSALPDRPSGPVNVPGVFNLAWVFRYSWSGRFDRMNDILDVAMTAPSAMATTWPDAVARLSASPRHRAAFERVYREPPTEAHLRDALERFTLTLTTPDAPFDRWLRGDASAISAEARDGYRLFRDYGCTSCHQGVLVGGNMYQRFGVMRDYFADRGGLTPADDGLFQRTRRPEDRHVFRVPSLRNVALTAPYFHDGSASTLEEAIETMARCQLGRPLPDEHRDRIVAFLETLTGRLDAFSAPAE